MNENQDLVSITPTGLNILPIKWAWSWLSDSVVGGMNVDKVSNPGIWLLPKAGDRVHLSRAFTLRVCVLMTVQKQPGSPLLLSLMLQRHNREMWLMLSPKLKVQSSSSLLEKPDPVHWTETTQTLRPGRLGLNPDFTSRWWSSWASGCQSLSFIIRKIGVKIYVREAPHFM